ncbi:Peptidase M23 [Anaeromyxobacter sp. K]|uniref:M23 family metallopeptidase n=1 Tax=Anaeromyxobacter sp. (strain K) TaxID=447217 RepID=UPI00017BE3D7|nr:M23 family metallopeptidase [Anaeromyxobacter sp. K]ACG74682.1 Peptidase M23 [Anaeromyxobacter sp. K]
MPLAPLLALLAAAAAPSLTLAPEAARPGDAVLVRVAGAGREAPRGTLGGRPLTFWRAGAEWRALAALPIETPAGELPAEAEAGGAALRATLRIVEPGFASRTLTLAPKYVEPPEAVKARIAADRKAFADAYARPFEPPAFARPFALPRRAPTSGRYGDQRVLNGEKPSVHYGLDLTGPRGAPVAAANAGRVVLVRDAYLSGRSVVLWHGAGIYTLYFHLDRVDVRAGQVVRRGQRIGRLGSTGRSTGPHLHWSVRVDGLLVDPESLVAIDFARGVAPARAPAPSPAVASPATVPPPTPAPAAVAAPAAPVAPATPAAQP